MRTLLLITALLSCLFFFACSEEGDTAITTTPTPVPAVEPVRVIISGETAEDDSFAWVFMYENGQRSDTLFLPTNGRVEFSFMSDSDQRAFVVEELGWNYTAQMTMGMGMGTLNAEQTQGTAGKYTIKGTEQSVELLSPSDYKARYYQNVGQTTYSESNLDMFSAEQTAKAELAKLEQTEDGPPPPPIERVSLMVGKDSEGKLKVMMNYGWFISEDLVLPIKHEVEIWTRFDEGLDLNFVVAQQQTDAFNHERVYMTQEKAAELAAYLKSANGDHAFTLRFIEVEAYEKWFEARRVKNSP